MISPKEMYNKVKILLTRVLMYSARCRRPWGTSRTDQDDDQDLAQLRRGREGHRGQREERGERDYSCPSSSQREEGGGQDYSCLNSSTLLPPSPPPHSPTQDQRGGEGAASQLTHMIRR